MAGGPAPPYSHTMWPPLLFALVAVVSVVTLVCVRLTLRRWPRHRICPTCATPTSALRPEGVHRHLSWLFSRRWCAACGWEGVSNPRPPVDGAGGELGHDSGFRWSPEPRDRTGFRWGAGDAASGIRRLAFRWARRRERGRAAPSDVHS